MKYEVNYTILGGKQNNIIFIFEAPYQLIGAFLWAESDCLEEYLQAIDEVLQGEKDFDESTASMFSVRVEREKSLISDILSSENPESCTVDTRELRKVIVEYMQKRAEFLKSKRADG